MTRSIVVDNRTVLAADRYECAPREDRFDRGRLISEFVGANRRVLELGCSTGFVSRLLKQNGCHVTGVEYDLHAIEKASRICDEVVWADLNQPSWGGSLRETFDVVLMGDVLEHLLFPEQALEQAQALLSEGGSIVISLPNIAHWTARAKIMTGHFDYQKTGLLDYTHVRFFTLRSARALIENSGYRITRFQAVIGGRLSDHFRPLWQRAANLWPTLCGYQLLFRAEPERQFSGKAI